MAGNETVPDGTPKLFQGELKAGEWMYSSKLSIATLMRPGNPLDVRIQSCLMGHCWGYSSEVAVWQRRGQMKGDPPVKAILTPAAIVKILAQAAIAHYEESAPKGTDRPDTRISRQYMRETLAGMDDDGIIDRMRVNCPLARLIGLSRTEALERGLVEPLRLLSPAARKKLYGGAICIYLLAKPRPAKTYTPGNVELKRYVTSQVVELTDQKRAIQLAFQFVPDLKHDPKRAAELVRREDVQHEIALYHRTIESAAVQAKARLSQFLKRVATDDSQQAELFTPDFHADLCERFQRAGKPVPTPKQSKAASNRVKGREADFLRTLTLDKMRRIEHPGVLPSLVNEFLATPVQTAPAAKPAAPVCDRCEGSGLVGIKWEKIPEAVAAVSAGAVYCECHEGQLAHDLIEPERLRAAGKAQRAS